MMASFLFSFSWIIALGDGSLPHHEDSYGVLWRGPCGKDWGPWQRPHKRDPAIPGRSPSDYSLTSVLPCDFMRDPEPGPLSWAPSEFLTHRNSEIINVCCFKLLILGAICYAAVDIQCSLTQTPFLGLHLSTLSYSQLQSHWLSCQASNSPCSPSPYF